MRSVVAIAPSARKGHIVGKSKGRIERKNKYITSKSVIGTKQSTSQGVAKSEEVRKPNGPSPGEIQQRAYDIHTSAAARTDRIWTIGPGGARARGEVSSRLVCAEDSG